VVSGDNGTMMITVQDLCLERRGILFFFFHMGKRGRWYNYDSVSKKGKFYRQQIVSITQCYSFMKILYCGQDMMVQVCNPSSLGSGDLEVTVNASQAKS
jgi:hypothetical protein